MTRASCLTNTEQTVTVGCKTFSNHLVSKEAYVEEQHLPRLLRYIQINNIQECTNPCSAINSYCEYTKDIWPCFVKESAHFVKDITKPCLNIINQLLTVMRTDSRSAKTSKKISDQRKLKQLH